MVDYLRVIAKLWLLSGMTQRDLQPMNTPRFHCFPYRLICRLRRLQFLLLLILLSTSRGAQINFNSTASLTADINRSSTGQPWDANYLMDLGVFDAGFVPTTSNLSEWAQHWHTAMRVTYNTKFRAFTGSHLVTTNTGVFTIGAKAYLWVFNPRGLGGEWLLVTADTWLWPDGSDDMAHPLSWSVAGGTQVVAGQVNPGNAIHMRSISAGTAQPPMQNYAGWAASRFTIGTAASLPEEDPDHDGISNRMEFALGLEPLVANGSSSMPAMGLALVNGVNCLQVVVPRRADRQVNYSVEASEDLSSWSRSTAEVLVVSTSITQLAYCDAFPYGSRGRRFIRVTVETY
jgi:hypothetical protein